MPHLDTKTRLAQTKGQNGSKSHSTCLVSWWRGLDLNRPSLVLRRDKLLPEASLKTSFPPQLVECRFHPSRASDSTVKEASGNPPGRSLCPRLDL